MSNTTKLGVIGGDDRQFYMVEYFSRMGYLVSTYGIEKEFTNSIVYKSNSLKEIMAISDVLICPIPFSKDKIDISNMEKCEDKSISEFLENLKTNHLLFSGIYPNSVKEYCEKNQIYHYDIVKDDCFSMLNAVATAEGTIAEAIKESNMNLQNSTCLITGFGKCAEILAKKLKALDALVIIVARSEEALSKAEAYGYETAKFEDMGEKLKASNFIFNTVPAIVFNIDNLKYIKNDALLIDIASMPGGVDFDLAKNLNKKTKHCLGLPGKYSPKTSGDILAKVIESKLIERSDGCEIR